MTTPNCSVRSFDAAIHDILVVMTHASSTTSCADSNIENAIRLYRECIDYMHHLSLQWGAAAAAADDVEEEDDLDDNEVWEDDGCEVLRCLWNRTHPVLVQLPIAKKARRDAAAATVLLPRSTLGFFSTAVADPQKDPSLFKSLTVFPYIMTVHADAMPSNKRSDSEHRRSLHDLVQEAQACLEYIGGLCFYNMAVCFQLMALQKREDSTNSKHDHAANGSCVGSDANYIRMWEDQAEDHYHMAMGSMDKETDHQALTWVELACLNNRASLQLNSLMLANNACLPNDLLQQQEAKNRSTECWMCGEDMRHLLYSLQQGEGAVRLLTSESLSSLFLFFSHNSQMLRQHPWLRQVAFGEGGNSSQPQAAAA